MRASPAAIWAEQELWRLSNQEAGCIYYSVAAVDGSTSDYVIMEVWETTEAWEAHTKTEHFVRLVPELQALTDGSLKLVRPVLGGIRTLAALFFAWPEPKPPLIPYRADTRVV